MLFKLLCMLKKKKLMVTLNHHIACVHILAFENLLHGMNVNVLYAFHCRCEVRALTFCRKLPNTMNNND